MIRAHVFAILIVPSLALPAPAPRCKPVTTARAREIARLPAPTSYRIDESGRASLAIGTGHHEQVERVCDIRSFFAAVRKFETRKPLLKTPGHTLEAGWARLLLDGRAVYDFAHVVARRVDGGGDTDAEQHAVPLSFVGPILSLDLEEGGNFGGGPPSNSGTWKTFDARTGLSADLFDWIDEQAVLTALKRDAFVQRHTTPEALAKIDTAAEFVALDEKWPESLLGPLRSTFCFFDYDPKRDLVAVRFPLFENLGFDHSKIEAIAVWVPPKPALRRALIAAKHGRGVFDRNAKRIPPIR